MKYLAIVILMGGGLVLTKRMKGAKIAVVFAIIFLLLCEICLFVNWGGDPSADMPAEFGFPLVYEVVLGGAIVKAVPNIESADALFTSRARFIADLVFAFMGALAFSLGPCWAFKKQCANG